MRRRHVFSTFNDNFAGFLFLLPYAILFLVFRVYPIFAGLFISLFKRDILGLENEFVGLGNYVALLGDEVFWKSLWNTFRYTLMSTPIMIPMAIALALALNSRFRGAAILRAAFFTPRILSVAVISLIWLWIYQPEWGLLNYYLRRIRLPDQNWLSDPFWAMFAIVIVAVWWNVGYQMIIFLAGLQQIPDHLYEAARVDGANAWGCFRHVTMPGLRPSLLFVLVTHFIGSFQIFGMVFIMTGGGPYDSTRVLVQYIYDNGFRYYKMGYASSLAYTLMVIILIFTLAQFRILRRQD
ncbi:MAG: carbohydrate ABC transporter permease [bacterium]